MGGVMTKSIFISAGHSDTDPGAIGGGLQEADIAVEFRNMVSFYLSQAGIAHALDGSETENLPLTQAAELASKHDIALEFHCNAAESSAATGVEVLAAAEDMAFASQLSGTIAEALAIRDRGGKPEDSGQHKRLAFVQSGGLVVELFFISNANDREQYAARKWLAAEAVAGVLIDAATSDEAAAAPVA